MAVERAHYPLLFAICLSLFTTPLMAAGVNAVLPEIGASLEASAAQLGLVSGVYSLGLAIFQLTSGSLGDICGHRRIFILGAIIFCLASLCAGFCSLVYVFLFFRLCQGIGGAMLSAAGLALLAAAAGPERRAAYLGLSGAAVYSGIACGPPVAGLIAGAIGWRWLFWLNACASLLVGSLMRTASRVEWRPAREKPFDWAGACYYAVAMSMLILGSASAADRPAIGISAFCLCGLTLVFFRRHENHNVFPVLNFRLLASSRVLLLSCLAALVNYASFFGLVFYFSFFIQIAHGMSVKITGFILAFQPLMQLAATPLATRLCNIWPTGLVCALGAALCGAGLLVAAFLTPASPLGLVFVIQGLLGAGISIFSLSNTAILLESAGRENIGQASGLTGAARTAGQLVSMCLTTASLAFFLGSEPVSIATLPGFMQSMRVNLVVLGLLNICAVWMALARNHD
ncbi:MAG: MFS transporter [Desulfovibrio sp.]|nr:MFS transporter [Desulfovibrio sp.]